jgi:hypothetical protein
MNTPKADNATYTTSMPTPVLMGGSTALVLYMPLRAHCTRGRRPIYRPPEPAGAPCRAYWNAQLKAKAEVELMPRLATWLVDTVDAAPNPNPNDQLFGALGLLQAQTALKNWLRGGPLLRPV